MIAVGLLLGACADSGPLQPYFAPLRPPGQDAAGPIPRGPQQVSVCYSSVGTSPEQVRKMVADNCTGAALVSNRTDLGVCSLALPIRAVYQCRAISQSLAEQRPPQLPTLSR